MTYRPSILVVDRDPMLRSMIEESLRESRYEVDTVADGASCLSHTQAERPDLVVLDSALPDYDAAEIVRRLRAEPTTSSIAIIMLTTLDAPQSHGDGAPYETGSPFMPADDVDIDGTVAKPFTTEMLVAKIRGVLDRHGG